MKENFEVALKVGNPVARRARENKTAFVVSECPLAREHIIQGMERANGGEPDVVVEPVQHPIQLLARAYAP
jgi:glycerol-3-phosphate dehydrogenase subunit C